VLQDALNNAFVKIEQICLLIFDEAHHCVKNNPGAVLMRNFYFHATKKPKILGLSASIVNPSELELGLDARVITPSRCRSELLHHVNRPVLQYLRYGQNELPYTQKLALLGRIKDNYDISKDPYFKKLKPERQHEFLVKNKRTLCLTELRTLHQKATHIFEQLGTAMADWYLDSSVRAILERIEKIRPYNLDSSMTEDEATHLLTLLLPLQTTAKQLKFRHEDAETFALQHLSPKVASLIDFLENEWSESFTGLIFVQQRALAYALAYLLSKYKFQRAQLRVQGFVGSSKVQDPAKRLVEQILPGDQKGVLEKFRSPEREINLLVATEVLGEGVDIPQCHLVVCFDLPPQITSYVQKRGRARLKDSKYILTLENDADDLMIKKWQKLENELNVAYQAEERAWLVSQQLEARQDPVPLGRQFRVATTGALLDLYNAVPKLHHLCQTLNGGSLNGGQPQFAFEEHPDRTVTATVTLPLTFEPSLRIAKSADHWLTENMAKRDAAFTAVHQLYEKGLLNEHLLPLKEETISEYETDTVELSEKASLCAVLPRFQPWSDIVKATKPMTTKWYTLDVTIQETGSECRLIELSILAPVVLPPLAEFKLYWNHKTQYSVVGKSSGLEHRALSANDVSQLHMFTEALLRSASGTRMPPGKNDFLFGIMLSPKEIEHWSANRLRDPLGAWRRHPPANTDGLQPGVVLFEGQKFLFRNLTKARLNEDEADQEVIEAVAYPKRRDFMHPFEGSTDAYTKIHQLPAPECVIEPFSISGAIASLFIPSILRRIELTLLAKRAQTTLLSPISTKSLPLIQAALTSRQSRETENYERLEFLGDMYINFLTTLNLMVEHPLWPEGYLTSEKGKRVSNDTFCNAGLRVGLDKFIVTDSFTGLKWKPPYVDELVAEAEKPIVRYESSKKRVADVVEATIAVAYLDGGHAAAIELCEIYFPERIWTTPDQQASQLFAAASDEVVHLESLEGLIGYKFRKPSLLLEAMTTSSYRGGDRNARSYERLEFLGDAVLEYLVVKRIYGFQGKELPHHAMHSIKAAAVNSLILGFLCMEHFSLEARGKVSCPSGTAVPEIQEEVVEKHIWQFVRSGTRTAKELRSLEKFEHMRDEIKNALDADKRYPWPLLSCFDPAKIFSDVIESILGAIYVDSEADSEICDQFLEGIGLYKVLDHLIRDNVACMHPKELMGLVAGQRKVKYVYGEEDKMVTCQVLVSGQPMGEVAKGEIADIASCLAAASAVEVEQNGHVYDIVEKVWKAVSGISRL
jgi:dsRNA-specific ribonuclease/ERCC4-related helicase